MEIRRRSVSIPPTSSSGPANASFTEVFPREVLSAVAGLVGFASGYDEQDDRPFGELEIRVTNSIVANTVTVEVGLGLRDWSGTFDDAYLGLIDVVLLVELENAAAGPVREDLQITGIEFTQATQYFRSALHLPASQVQPDNSIPLVARKNLGVRVYVDYDAASGLPNIGMLTGELEVQTATQLITLSPIESMVPRRDVQIDRGEFGHTLNFLVDAEDCQGTVDFRCRVFDEADPTQVSQASQSTRQFTEFAPMRLFIVGIEYTGDGANLPAPTQQDILRDLDYTERVFPIPEVIPTGYAVLQDFDKSPEDDDGLNEANKLIRDLKGDSEDAYLGIFPIGTPFGDFTGQQTQGVASGAGNDQVLIAHELGHLFGRLHPPCLVPSACDNPGDLDEDYPQYGSYARHSIGEYGFDPLQADTGNMVRPPANWFDYMSYARFNRWTSPNTYVALMTPDDAVGGGSAVPPTAVPATAAPTGVWQPKKQMILFLDMEIDKKCRVERRTSFHFPAFAAERRGASSPFRAEFWDECHNVLSCAELYEDAANCVRCCCYKFFSKLPFPSGARWLVIFKGCTKIYEECIKDPPKMSIDCNYDQGPDRFKVAWSAQSPDIEDHEIWYLVQWEDLDGTWRGLMPRTQERSVTIDPALLGNRREMRVRVLASSGIATGEISCNLNLPRAPRVPASVIVSASPSGSTTAYLVDTVGRALPAPGFIWHDDQGREIGRGRKLSGRNSQSAREIRAVASRYIAQSDSAGHAAKLRTTPKDDDTDGDAPDKSYDIGADGPKG